MLDDAVYEDVSVEQIMDKRTVEGGTAGAMTEYLIRWSDGSEDTWEPATNIADDLIQVCSPAFACLLLLSLLSHGRLWILRGPFAFLWHASDFFVCPSGVLNPSK